MEGEWLDSRANFHEKTAKQTLPKAAAGMDELRAFGPSAILGWPSGPDGHDSM